MGFGGVYCSVVGVDWEGVGIGESMARWEEAEEEAVAGRGGEEDVVAIS